MARSELPPREEGEGAYGGALKRGKVLVNNGNNDGGGKVRAT